MCECMCGLACILGAYLERDFVACIVYVVGYLVSTSADFILNPWEMNLRGFRYCNQNRQEALL